MLRLILVLLFSGLGGVFILHYLKNFFLEEKTKLKPDWDGFLERALITFLVLSAPNLWPLIPVLIAAKVFCRLWLLGSIPAILKSNEPGAAFQKVLFKSELAFDLLLSPAFAILLGAVFR
jgi:hypothetical protein